jgi:glycosyltransferase involved in cell wall biosynthesis
VKEPLISIIVPVYNAQEYLSKCIESILNQTMEDFELILVNDGSKDKSPEICDEYSLKDSRIKVIHKKNEGVSIARNTGINISKGTYIVFSDSDDYVDDDWCYEMYKEIINNNMVMCGITIHNIRKNKNIINKLNVTSSENISRIKKKDFFILYQKQLISSPCNKMYITKIIKDNDVRFKENLTLGEDLLFNLEYLKFMDEDIIVVNKPLYNYILTDKESLDNRYYENLFEIYNMQYSELYSFMELFNADIKAYEASFYASYFYMLMRVLHNTFNKKNKALFFEKIDLNSKILRSKEFKKCLEKIDRNDYNKIHLLILESGNYYLEYVYDKLVNIKNVSKELTIKEQ